MSNAQALSGVDASLERKPGGALGNGQSTGDSAADFQIITPAKPQNLASPPVTSGEVGPLRRILSRGQLP